MANQRGSAAARRCPALACTATNSAAEVEIHRRLCSDSFLAIIDCALPTSRQAAPRCSYARWPHSARPRSARLHCAVGCRPNRKRDDEPHVGNTGASPRRSRLRIADRASAAQRRTIPHAQRCAAHPPPHPGAAARRAPQRLEIPGRGKATWLTSRRSMLQELESRLDIVAA